MPGEVYLQPFDEHWDAGFEYKGEPGWYVHKGRVFIQGVIDLAGKPLSKADELRLEAGEELEPFSAALLTVPAAYAPPHTITIPLLVDPYWTTPGYHRPDIQASLEGSGGDFALVVNNLKLPPGKYGEFRVIISCFWDTAEANKPGEGANNPFEADTDFTDLPLAGIAIKGSRVWLSEQIRCTSDSKTGHPANKPATAKLKSYFIKKVEGEADKEEPGPEDVLLIESIPEGEFENGYHVVAAPGKAEGSYTITLLNIAHEEVYKSPDLLTLADAVAWAEKEAEWIFIKVVNEPAGITRPLFSTVEMGGGFQGAEAYDPGDEEEPPLPEVTLHNGAPIGPHNRMRSTSGYPPDPSVEFNDGVGYTVGQASKQGPAVIKVEDRAGASRLQIETGVFPTDRYTFYDVAAFPPHSRPSLGRYTTPGFANSKDATPVQIGLSGPSHSEGMALFIGDITQIPVDPLGAHDLSLYLCVPPGDGGPGQGYYRFDILNLLKASFGPLASSDIFLNPGETATAVLDPEWEVESEIEVKAFEGPKVIFNAVNWSDKQTTANNEAPSYFQQWDASGYGHKFMIGSGWGWFPIPPGPKSVLVYVTTRPSEQLREEQRAQVSDAGGNPAAKAPPGATFLVFEWGEVGKLPFESRAANKGRRIVWDPTPYITDSGSPVPAPVFAKAAEEFLSIFLLPIGPIVPGLVTPFMIPFFLTKYGLEATKIFFKYYTHWEVEWELYMDRFKAKLPAGRIPPYGDAAIRSGAQDSIANALPMWASEWPLPRWNTMKPGEDLDMNGAGYAAKPVPGDITIGPGQLGIVPKN